LLLCASGHAVLDKHVRITFWLVRGLFFIIVAAITAQQPRQASHV